MEWKLSLYFSRTEKLICLILFVSKLKTVNNVLRHSGRSAAQSVDYVLRTSDLLRNKGMLDSTYFVIKGLLLNLFTVSVCVCVCVCVCGWVGVLFI